MSIKYRIMEDIHLGPNIAQCKISFIKYCVIHNLMSLEKVAFYSMPIRKGLNRDNNNNNNISML